VLTRKLVAHILTFLIFTFLLTIKNDNNYKVLSEYLDVTYTYNIIILAKLCSPHLKPTTSQAVARIADRSASQQAI